MDNGGVTCLVCGLTVPRKQVNQVTCGSPACRYRNGNVSGFTIGETYKCRVCGVLVVRRHANYVTCGAAECQRINHAQQYRWAKDAGLGQ